LNREIFEAGIENHTCEGMASLFIRIWKDSPDQMCYARMIFDRDGAPADYIFLDVNPAMEKTLGLNKEQVTGQRFTGLFPRHDPGWIRKCGDVVRTGRMLATEEHNSSQDAWYAVQVFALDSANEFITICHDVTERKRAEETLRASEEKYRTLFNSIDEGFCVIEVLFDDNDRPLDYRFLEMNQAFKRQTGLVDATGRCMREMAPEHEQHWFDIYGRIALTGEPARFQNPADALGFYYDVYAFRVGKPAQRQVGILFNDIAERKRDEEALRESEERQTFLLNLSDAVRPLSDPVEIQGAVARAVMEYFGADRCYYCEIENDKVIIRRDASRGDLSSIVGVYPLNSLPVHKSLVDAGLPIIVPNVRTTGLVDKELRQLCIQLKVISYLGIPVIKDEKPVGLLCITQASPRSWTAAQVALAKDIAERIWATVKRAVAEEALRASEERFRGFIETAGEGIVESDAGGRIVFVNKQMAHMLGCTENELVGRMGLEFTAEDQAEQALEARQGLAAGVNITREHKLRHKDGSIVWTLCNATPLYDGRGRYRGSLAMHADITRRKRVEEEKQVLLNALQVEKDRLSVLISNIPDEVWFTDNRGNVVITNQSTREEFNSSYQGLNAAEILASLEITCADGNPLPVAKAPLLRAVKGEEIINHEEIIRTPVNNKLRHRQVNAAPVRDNDGNIIGAVAIARDITEQKRAEKEHAMNRLDKISTLYVNNGDLSAILNEILEMAISFTGTDMGNIQLLDAESGLLRIMAHHGFKQPFLDFFTTVGHGTATCGTALHRGERVIVEDVTRSPIFAGTPALDVLLAAGVRAVQSTPLVSRSGRLMGMLSTHFRSPHIPEEHDLQLVDLLAHQAADVIERKKSEEALRRSEEHFSMIFNNSPDMIIIINQETDKFVDVNRRFTEVLGYAREEVIGRTLQELNYLMDLQQQEQKHKSGNLMGNEMVLQSKSGQLINVLFSMEVAEIGLNKQKIIIFKDITKIKEMESEITRLDRLNLVGEMAAGIGHEVRNPMTTVRGFLQFLGKKERHAGDREIFELMIEELDRANSIISEFLSLARNKAVNLEKKDLNKILKVILPLLQADGLVTDKYVHLKTRKTPRLLIDEKEIRQLVLNLVHNGLQAMEPGKTLTLETFVDEDDVVLAVKDQGSGIPGEIIDKIGTPFFTTKDTGTGLGLAICFSIVARHNARMDYETSTEGTTFYVHFPTKAVQRLSEMEISDRGGGVEKLF